MEDFVGALVCDHKNDRIPEEYNFFGKLVGVWDLDWNDHLHEAKKKTCKGRMDFLVGTGGYGYSGYFHRTFKS